MIINDLFCCCQLRIKRSALFLACEDSDALEIVQYLLSVGANHEVANNTAFAHALNYEESDGKFSTCDCLLETNGNSLERKDPQVIIICDDVNYG